MGNEDEVKYWIGLAEYDLKTAEAMLKTDRLLYVGFMCHQAVEKTLKAHVAKVTRDMAPRTHNLARLADIAGLLGGFSETQEELIASLTPLNIEARYPKDIEGLAKLITRKRAGNILQETKELITWLRKQL